MMEVMLLLKLPVEALLTPVAFTAVSLPDTDASVKVCPKVLAKATPNIAIPTPIKIQRKDLLLVIAPAIDSSFAPKV